MSVWDAIRDDAELEHARKAISFRDFHKIVRHAQTAYQTDYRAAVLALIDNPHGCAFCDYGNLRNPDKGHGENCPYDYAERLLAEGRQ